MQRLGTRFLAVKDYKEFTDVDDELYMYKVDENEQITFKISSFKMKLPKAMNSENEELPSEFCFSDGKVKHTKRAFTFTARNSFLIEETLYYVQTTPPFIILIIQLIIPNTYPFLMRFRTLVHCNKHISLFSQ